MRLLHTSDWHIGVTTRGLSRRSDQEVALEELAEQARDFRPDLVIHSGDLFHLPRPQVEELDLAWTGLRNLAELAPVVVIAGNHDSPQLFDFFAAMLGPQPRIHFVGQPKSPSQGGILKFHCSGQTAKLACLPFVHANRMLKDFDQDLGTRMVSYADRLMRLQRAYAEALQKGYQAQRDVLLFAAHLFVDGASLSASERSLHVSDTYAIRSGSIPPVSYAAFGHIHKPQALPGGICGRYAGSLVPIDFGEEHDAKETVLVEAHPGQSAHIERVPFRRGRRFCSLEGSKSELEAMAPAIGEAILRLKVHLAHPDPGLSDWANQVFAQAEVIEIAEIRPQQAPPRLAPGVSEELPLDRAFAEYATEMGLGEAGPLSHLLAELEPLLVEEGRFPLLAEVESL